MNPTDIDTDRPSPNVAVYDRVACIIPGTDQDDRVRSCVDAARRRFDVQSPTIFRDLGRSGMDIGRKGLGELLAAVRAGGVAVVIVDELHALSRDAIHLHAILQILEFYGAKLFLSSGGVAVTSEHSWLAAGAAERAARSFRIKRGIAEAKRRRG